MNRYKVAKILLACAILSTAANGQGPVDESPPPPPISVAVLGFTVSEGMRPETGNDLAVLLTVELSMRDGLLLVERTSLEKILGEQGIGMSGAVNPATASQVGELVGAKVMVSGRVIGIGSDYYAVAKVMGTETGRVFGEKVKFSELDALDEATTELAEKVAVVLEKQRGALVAEKQEVVDLVAMLKPKLKGKTLPSVYVEIPEWHIGRAVPDPAAQTELVRLLRQLGFEVLDKGKRAEANVVISGEAFSEFAMRLGEMVSCRARVEVKLTEVSSSKLLWADRETAISLGLAENIAGKDALQQAALEMSERLVMALIGETPQ